MKKRNRKPMVDHSFIPGLIGVVFLLITLAALYYMVDSRRSIEHFKSSTFLTRLERGDIQEVVVVDHEVNGILKDGTKFTASIPKDEKIWAKLKQYDVVYDVQAKPSQTHHWYIIVFGSMFLCLVMVWYFARFLKQQAGGAGGGGGIFAAGKSKARMFMPSTVKTRFKDVAGAAEAKEDLEDIVEYLKNPQKYKRLGAKIPRGVLLVGEPGTGKTLLARAIAGEANVPFFSTSGSDFIELYVGVGAARMRDLFAQAAKNAPAIIFIDEIDAIGRKRSASVTSGQDERDQTLNQLLVELDGFANAENNVIIIAATNRPDVLDKALLRPGRFDRRVNVPLPDQKTREEILGVHGKKVKLHNTVNLERISRGTPGFSGADLEGLINEAAIIATKLDREAIMPEDFEAARDKVTLGKPIKTLLLTEEDRKITAYHEAGHALMVLLHPEDAEPLHKVTIIPHPGSLGHTQWLPEREKYNRKQSEILASIRIACGGRVAEEYLMGQVTTGASSDFSSATKMARDMIAQYGMSKELGLPVYQTNPLESGYSEQTAQKVDAAVQDLLDKCYQETKKLMNDNKDKLEKLAQALIEKETMYSDEIYALLDITPRVDHKIS